MKETTGSAWVAAGGIKTLPPFLGGVPIASARSTDLIIDRRTAADVKLERGREAMPSCSRCHKNSATPVIDGVPLSSSALPVASPLRVPPLDRLSTPAGGGGAPL